MRQHLTQFHLSLINKANATEKTVRITSNGFFYTKTDKRGVIIMYVMNTKKFGGEANAVNSRLIGGDVVEQAKALNAGRINKTDVVSAPNSTGVGVAINPMSPLLNNEQMNPTNQYMVSQKLRNSGMYTKLKNKTIYSVESLSHASLNSGIL